MYRLMSLTITCAVLCIAHSATMPQDLGDFDQREEVNERRNVEQGEDVNSRYYSGKQKISVWENVLNIYSYTDGGAKIIRSISREFIFLQDTTTATMVDTIMDTIQVGPAGLTVDIILLNHKVLATTTAIIQVRNFATN